MTAESKMWYVEVAAAAVATVLHTRATGRVSDGRPGAEGERRGRRA